MVEMSQGGDLGQQSLLSSVVELNLLFKLLVLECFFLEALGELLDFDLHSAHFLVEQLDLQVIESYFFSYLPATHRTFFIGMGRVLVESGFRGSPELVD
jgi:hypothetical protein